MERSEPSGHRARMAEYLAASRGVRTTVTMNRSSQNGKGAQGWGADQTNECCWHDKQSSRRNWGRCLPGPPVQPVPLASLCPGAACPSRYEWVSCQD